MMRARCLAAALLAVQLGFQAFLASPALADCTSACQSDYWACTAGFDERDCATTRSICYLRCSTNSFGAISYSDATGAYGWSNGHPSRQAAEMTALSYCRTQDGAPEDCRILTWFRFSCAALARDPEGPYGADWGQTKHEAAAKAIAICQQYGGASCEIEASICSR